MTSPDVPLPAPGDTSWSDWAQEQEEASDRVRAELDSKISSTSIDNDVVLTQAAYDALATKDARTRYTIVG